MGSTAVAYSPPSKSGAITRLVPGGAPSNARVPVVYAEAVKALRACQTIDESKYFADKADALAAWARIYKHDEAAVEAKRLKLHAFRRMGQLARQVEPARRRTNTRGGTLPGAQGILEAHGLSRCNATAALRLARAPNKQFARVTSKPKSPSAASKRFTGNGQVRRRRTNSWKWLVEVDPSSGDGARLRNVRSNLLKRPAREVAAGIAQGEVKKARELAVEIIEWLDEFEQALPKEK